MIQLRSQIRNVAVGAARTAVGRVAALRAARQRLFGAVIMSQCGDDLLFHQHRFADRAVLALDETRRGAGRGHCSIHSGLVVAASKLACATDARGRIVVVGAGGIADIANTVDPVVGAHQIPDCANAVDPVVGAAILTVQARAVAPAVLLGYISSVSLAAAGPHLLMVGRRLIPFPICGSVFVGIIIRIVSDRAYGAQTRRTIDIMVFPACRNVIITIVAECN